MEREARDLLTTLLVDVASRNAAGYGKNSRSGLPRSGLTPAHPVRRRMTEARLVRAHGIHERLIQ